MEEVISYKCKVCGRLHTKKSACYKCEYIHAREELANSLWEEGNPLSTIEYSCRFGWNLKDHHKEVTKDNCFIMSHWQCCSKPAYQITRIDDRGNLRLGGRGSWSGWYANYIQYRDLPDPYPKEELFVDSR